MHHAGRTTIAGISRPVAQEPRMKPAAGMEVVQSAAQTTNSMETIETSRVRCIAPGSHASPFIAPQGRQQSAWGPGRM